MGGIIAECQRLRCELFISQREINIQNKMVRHYGDNTYSS